MQDSILGSSGTPTFRPSGPLYESLAGQDVATSIREKDLEISQQLSERRIIQLEEENQMLTERLLDWEAGDGDRQTLQIQELFESQIDALSSKYEERLCEADARLLELESLCLLKDSQTRQLRDIISRLETQLNATNNELMSFRSKLEAATSQKRSLENQIQSCLSVCEQGSLTEYAEMCCSEVGTQVARRTLSQHKVAALSLEECTAHKRRRKTDWSVQIMTPTRIPPVLPPLSWHTRVFVCQILAFPEACSPPRGRGFMEQTTSLQDRLRSPLSFSRSQNLSRSRRPPVPPSTLGVSLPLEDLSYTQPSSSSPRNVIQRRQETVGLVSQSPLASSACPRRPMTTSLSEWRMAADLSQPRAPTRQRDLSLLRQTLNSHDSMLIGTRGRKLNSREITLRFNM